MASSSSPLQDVKMSDGCNIKAKILNPQDKQKPLLLTCHGGPGLSTHGECELNYGTFTDLFRVLVSDLRGSGESDQQRPYTHARWIQDLDELRQWAGDSKVTFIGASHGGSLGLEYALAFPERVEALVLGDTTAQFGHACLLEGFKTALTDPRTKDIVDPDQLHRLFTGTTTSFEDFVGIFGVISPLYAVPEHAKDPEEEDLDLGATMASFVKPIWETNSAAYDDCMSRYDVRDRLHEIEVPVFVFVGTYDWLSPPKYARAVAEGVKNGTFVEYTSSGHIAAMEQKKRFRKDLRAWFEKVGIPGL